MKSKMIDFKKTDSNRCLICNNEPEDVSIFNMCINRPFRNNENVISFAICENCLMNMRKCIDIQLRKRG